MRERIEEVCDQLVGTCLDIRAIITDEEFANEAFLLELDRKVFKCDVCGWWFQVADKSANTSATTCYDCEHQEKDYEED